MVTLTWDSESDSRAVAAIWNPVRNLRAPREQYQGKASHSAVTWQGWMGSTPFPSYVLVEAGNKVDASVGKIKRAFREGDYLAGVILTFAWGGMQRQKVHLIGPPGANEQLKIEAAFRLAADMIIEDGRIERAWNHLDMLHWSAVAKSKTLHFLARALGCEKYPPVPIDNAAILNTLLPEVGRRAINSGIAPPRWRGGSWEAYSAYMTVIIAWAREMHWTTTQVEASIFDLYQEEKLVKPTASSR